MYEGIHKILNKLITLFILSGLLYSGEKTPPVYEFEQVEKWISQEVHKGAIPSLVVAVAKNGRIIFERAFGWADMENYAYPFYIKLQRQK